MPSARHDYVKGVTPSLPKDRRPDPRDDDELNLAPHIRTLWNAKYLIVGLAVAAAAVGFFGSRRLTPQYISTVKVWVAPPKFGTESGPAVNAASFRSLLQNAGLAAEAIREFKLDQAPYRLTPVDFITANLDIELVRETNVLLIHVRLWEADLTARVANRIAAGGVALATRLGREDSIAARDTMLLQVDQAKGRLDEAEKERTAFRRTAQIELLRKDVETLLVQRGDLRKLLTDIARDRARVSQFEAMLAQKKRIDTLNRSIDPDSAVVDAARGDLKSARAQVSSEVVNPVYDHIDRELAMARSSLSGRERQRDQLTASVNLSSAELKQLTTLYQREATLQRLDAEYELAKGTYTTVATNYQQAELLIASRSAQLQILDPALPASRPVWPRPVRSGVMAGAAVFALCAAGVLVAAQLRRPE